MAKELEVKFYPIEKEDFRKRLLQIGAQLIHPERLMRRKTFDFVNLQLPENHYKWVRIRDEGNKITMTIKYLVNEDRLDNTDEVEIIVDSFENASEFLLMSGLKETNYQENYRETWQHQDYNAEITIDTWPGLEPLVEIEGESETVLQSLSHKLGFDYSQALFGSMDFVYEKILNVQAGDLVNLPILTFANAQKELRKLAKIAK